MLIFYGTVVAVAHPRVAGSNPARNIYFYDLFNYLVVSGQTVYV